MHPICEKNRDTVKAIAEALKADGWRIACAGYDHSYMNDLGADALKGATSLKRIGVLATGYDVVDVKYS